jgi:hypothetical protein
MASLAESPENAGGAAPARPRVQLVLEDAAFSRNLRETLLREPAFAGWPVDCCRDTPDLTQPGVIVLDVAALERLGAIPHPERVVLITQRDPRQLTRAWDAGIVSVIYQDEPLSTAMLAVMAARFRAAASLP